MKTGVQEIGRASETLDSGLRQKSGREKEANYGYSQHWVAFTHINQEWIPLIIYLLSFGFTARALRTSDKFKRFTIYALLLLAAGVFPTEYFIGLEPLRFFFICVIVSEEWHTGRDRLLQTLRLWVPYLLVWIGYLAWMTYFYTIGNYDSYDVVVAQTPPTLLQILGTALQALWKGGFYSWGQILVLIAKAFATPTSLLTVALIAVTFAFLRWVGTKHKLTGESPKSSNNRHDLPKPRIHRREIHHIQTVDQFREFTFVEFLDDPLESVYRFAGHKGLPLYDLVFLEKQKYHILFYEQNKKDELVRSQKHSILSFPWRRESSLSEVFWTSASAGVTTWEAFYKRIKKKDTCG